MSIVTKLENLKNSVMDMKEIDLKSRIKVRNLISELITEVKEEEKGIDVPECVDYSKIKTTWTIDSKNIGADI